ncbi:MAG: hypothetical protein JWR16_1554 [Nevskia sp.]|nr:hypothetical protein [Nevskia sp.]
MDQRVSMIMTGARDIPRLRAFYENGLGWVPWAAPSAFAVGYRVGHSVLVFLHGDYLAQQRGEPLSAGSKTSLAVFVESKQKVDELYRRALASGARVSSPVRERDEGLYTGYFCDPEGNNWEIVWSPHMPLDAEGALIAPST